MSEREEQRDAASAAVAAEVPASGDGAVGGASWWGFSGLIDVAKQKSASAIDFVRKDLQEFTCTMQQDSTLIATSVKTKLATLEGTDGDEDTEDGDAPHREQSMLSWIGGIPKTLCTQENASTASQKVRQGMSSLLGGIKGVLIVPPDSDEETETITSSSHVFDRAKARLHAIQVDQGTYTNEPSEPREKFQEFVNGFDLEGKKGNISELLVSNVKVRALYTQLVPSSVSHADFWQRYYYKVHQLDEDQARRDDLMKRADGGQHDSELAWDDEDDWGDSDVASSPPKATAIPLGEQTSACETHTPAAAVAQQITSTLETLQPAEGNDHHIDEQTVAKVLEDEYSCETADSTGSGVGDAAGNLPVFDSVDNAGVGAEAESGSPRIESTRQDSSADCSAKSSAVAVAESRASEVPSMVPVVQADSSAGASAEAGDIPVVQHSLAESGGASGVDGGASGIEEDAAVAPMVELRTKERGDLVVVGASGSGSEDTPSSTVSSNGNNKESLDEDWEKDFDIEVTEDDIRLAQEAAKSLSQDGDPAKEPEDDDWENWE